MSLTNNTLHKEMVTKKSAALAYSPNMNTPQGVHSRFMKATRRPMWIVKKNVCARYAERQKGNGDTN
jgi:hypothetical protein